MGTLTQDNRVNNVCIADFIANELLANRKALIESNYEKVLAFYKKQYYSSATLETKITRLDRALNVALCKLNTK